jgi:tetratricopeptide (TPR) repeat protein
VRRLGWGRATVIAIVSAALVRSGNERRAADAAALVQRGEALLLEGRAAAALAAFQDAGRRDPEDTSHLDAEARALEALGRPIEAIALRESVAARARREGWPLAGRAAALRNLGLAAWRQGQVDLAVRALGEMRAIGASTLESDLVVELARLRRGEAVEVERGVPELRARHGDVEPVWKLHIAARTPGSDGESRVVLEAFVGLRRSPGPAGSRAAGPLARALCADSLLDAGDAAGAAHLWAGSTRGALASLAQLSLATVAQQDGRWEEALRHLELAAADASVPRETIFYRRGRILAGAGRGADARAALRNALAANPLSARSERSLAQIGP